MPAPSPTFLVPRVSAFQVSLVGDVDVVAFYDQSRGDQKLFAWGHISEPDYLREAARLKELREQLKGSLRATRTVQIRGIRELWENGGADARRASP